MHFFTTQFVRSSMTFMTKNLIYLTTKNKAEAKKIGRILIEEKLASCINAWEGVDSIYWWKRKIEETKEGILLIKTSEEKTKQVVNRIKTLHSYDCPCIIILHTARSAVIKQLSRKRLINDKKC